MTQRHWTAVAGLAVATISASAWWAHATGSSEPSARRARRAFVVSLLRDGQWKEVGAQPFGRFYATRTYDLPSSEGGLTVRVAARGGGAAQLDAVLLDGATPTGHRRKLGQVDADVIDAREPLELRFSASSGHLAVTGRIEPETINKTPFQFPRGNTFRPMTTRSQFFRYALGSHPGRLTVDGELDPERLGDPLFAEQIYCDSGHPQGLTYGWVRNDDSHLYVALDFTPDNTMDGEADYAKVYVNRGDQLLEYVVTTSQRQFGTPGFTYTERVGYQHKTYELAIPLERIRTLGQDELELAFATYGTASAGMNGTHPLAFEPNSATFGFIYWEMVDEYEFRLQRYGAGLAPLGQPILLGTTTGSQPFSAVATDTIHGAFLVTWEYFTEGLIFGRRVFANGTIDGAAFEISTTTAGDQTETPRAAFDPDNDRWLVVWSDMRSGTGRYLYGRFVGSDGAPQGEDLTLYDAGRVRDGNGGVAHSPQDSQFLVAVTPSSGGSLLALRVDASTGAVTGDRVPLGSGVAPEVAFSQVSGKYLVAWIDDTVVRGQTVAPDGTVGVEHQYMTVTDGTPANVAVVAHHTVERFAVVGDRWGTDDSIWGRYVDANDGAAVGTTFLASDPSRAPDWNGAALNTVNHGIAIGSYDLDAGEPFVSYIVGLCFAGSPATTSEDGSSATIEVQLCAAPTGDVLVNVASGNTNEGTVSPASLTFSPANWQTPQAVTVTPIGDGIVDGDTEYRVSFAVDDANSADDYDGVIDAVWITNTNVDLLDDGSGSPSAPDGGCNCRAQPQPALLLVALAGTLLTRRSRRRRLSPHR